MDGTDFPVNEVTPFNPQYFSHKFLSAGVRYDVGLNIVTGEVVYWGGGYPAGMHNDLELARIGIVPLLQPGEKVIADKGYEDRNYFIFPTDLRGDNSLIKKITARHENINARLKCWAFLRNRFRHGIEMHNRFFSAVIEIEQFKLKHGNKMQAINLDLVTIS